MHLQRLAVTSESSRQQQQFDNYSDDKSLVFSVSAPPSTKVGLQTQEGVAQPKVSASHPRESTSDQRRFQRSEADLAGFSPPTHPFSLFEDTGLSAYLQIITQKKGQIFPLTLEPIVDENELSNHGSLYRIYFINDRLLWHWV